jgi:hypothetical protein
MYKLGKNGFAVLPEVEGDDGWEGGTAAFRGLGCEEIPDRLSACKRGAGDGG